MEDRSMTKRANLGHAMYSLIEATHAISDITGVPVETLIVTMLAAVKPDDADALIEAGKFFAPLRVAPGPVAGSSVAPVSARHEHLLTLIQRDNPKLYKKLMGLD
jgi:hypothetical protein